MKKKIGLFLDTNSKAGGAFQYSYNILNALQVKKEEFNFVIVYSNKDWKQYVDESSFKNDSYFLIRPIWLEYLQLIWRKIGFSTNIWRNSISKGIPYCNFFTNLNCDLWIFPAQDAMAYMLPVRSISTIHDLMHKYEKRFPEVSGYRLREYHYNNVCKTSSAILVDSKIGKKQVIESYSIEAKKIFVLPFIPPYYKICNNNVKQKYVLPNKYFFYPAQFWQHKNHEIIIHALARLIDAFPDMVFVFSGAAKNHYKFIIKLIDRYNLKHAIKLLGFIPNEDIPYIYKHARALVMPTFFGPTNIPPIEAMSLGCPVAVSDIYGMPEQIGDAGLFFNPNSIDELIEVLTKLWKDDDLCKILSEKGKERMLILKKDSFDNNLFKCINNVLF